MVVISIITILAAVLVPAIVSVRATAKDTKCVSNLRGIGTMIHLYIQAYDDFLPPCGPGKNAKTGKMANYQVWYRAILPYGDNWHIFECPSKYNLAFDVPEHEPLPGQTPSATEKYFPVNYGMNYMLFGTSDDMSLYGNSFQVDYVLAPSQVLIVADGGVYDTIETALPDAEKERPDSIVNGGIWFPTSSGAALETGRPIISPRHRNNSICLFLDGSVQRLVTKEILMYDRGDSRCLYQGKIVE